MTPACTNEAVSLWPLFWMTVAICWTIFAWKETPKG